MMRHKVDKLCGCFYPFFLTRHGIGKRTAGGLLAALVHYKIIITAANLNF